MSTIRTLMMITALAAGSVACHDKPAEKAVDKPASAAVPATTGTPATADKPVTTAKPASADTIPDADAQRFYAFIEQLVAIAVANQDDCAKMAAGVAAFAEANKALIKDASDMQQQHKDLPPAIKEKMARKFKDELGPAVTKKCSKDKAVMDAFQKIKSR